MGPRTTALDVTDAAVAAGLDPLVNDHRQATGRAAWCGTRS